MGVYRQLNLVPALALAFFSLASPMAAGGFPSVDVSASTPDSSVAAAVGVTPHIDDVSIVSLTLNPSAVAGRTQSTATVVLSGPAPAGGTTIAMFSSNTSVATVPSSVIFVAGTSSRAIPVPTFARTSTMTSTITATLNSASRSATLFATPALSALSVTSVAGGTAATGTLTFVNATSGAVVSISSSNPALAQVPATVLASGGVTKTFTISTTGVSVKQTVTITASYSGVTKTAVLTINPPIVNLLTVSPGSVTGSLTSTATVTLNGVAGSGGRVVTLSSSNASVASLPASVTVPQGSSSASFTVHTSPVATSTSVTLSAVQGATKTAVLTVIPPTLLSVSANPASIAGGQSTIGTVTLSNAAPPGGAVVTFTATAGITILPPVTIASGHTTATFPIHSAVVFSTLNKTITATYKTVTRTLTVVVSPAISGLAISPVTLFAGQHATGTVTFANPVSSVASVALTSSSPALQVPSTVHGNGTTTATFSINTTSVNAGNTVVMVSAVWGATRTVTITVKPPTVFSLSISPSTVTGSSTSTGTLTMTAAPTVDKAVALQSVFPGDASVPSSVTVPASHTSAQFQISTFPVSSTIAVGITATDSGNTERSQITILPPVLIGLSFDPAFQAGGSSSTGTVLLNGSAPAGGMVVTLSSDNGFLTVPANVTVPAGDTSATFIAARPAGVLSNTISTVSATLNGTTVTGSATTTPPLKDLTLSADSVAGGSSLTGAASLFAAASGVTVTLTSSNPSVVHVPATVSFSGSSAQTFTITTSPVTLTTNVTISASYSGTTKATTLTVTP